uniref:Uncharacterized protein n=1 Tax=Anguilla anguilla TaxID=7936 RepID=A0A0E9S1L5_ANGAN
MFNTLASAHQNMSTKYCKTKNIHWILLRCVVLLATM